MRTSALHLVAAVLLGGSCAGWLGCGRDSVVDVHRDAKGNQEVHVDSEKAKDNLNKAGDELSKDAHNLGQAVEQGAHDLDRRVGPAVRESVADAALTARVKARLIAAPDLGGIRVHVSSRNGQVTLTGTVSSEEFRQEAEKITRRTEGVTEVANQLQVGPTG